MKRGLLFSWILTGALIINGIRFAKSDCNVCNSITNMACVSETEYQQCEDNKPFGQKYSCNSGYFCSILGTCTQDESIKDCQECGKCDETRTFACTGTQTFALCLGEDRQSDIKGECNANLMCNINNPQICGNSGPTCSFRDDSTTSTTTTTTTTTISPVENPNGFCQAYEEEGRFPLGTDPDTTCRQYVRCIKIGDVWYGPVYNCPGDTYFDSSKGRCVAEVPSTCSGRVGRLTFNNISLE